jgi:glycosyltransferase involved in cell wall biosynthesis
MKAITFAVPCYNSAEYMDKCIESLLALGDDIEILIVDDGSTKDDTPAKADAWQEAHPGIIRAIHQENGGHGAAVNTGLANATGLYFKVVDSDDWVDAAAGERVMTYIRKQLALVNSGEAATDMVVANYVYEKVYEDSRFVMGYKKILPIEREFDWSEAGNFSNTHYLVMHAVIYRTELLRDMNLQLPRHCFYVDNIFVYEPLPHVKTIYYMDVDFYRYFIGREDQSVNEKVMMSRIDQHVRVAKQMIDAVDVMAIPERHLRKYMESYLSMMLTIASVFLRLKNTKEDDAMLADTWAYLKAKDPALYKRIRTNVLNVGSNLPTSVGRKLGTAGYHLSQKIFKFN